MESFIFLYLPFVICFLHPDFFSFVSSAMGVGSHYVDLKEGPAQKLVSNLKFAMLLSMLCSEKYG